MHWILRETLASQQQRKPIYFKCITEFGPCSTTEIDQAARFASKQEAMMSPAYVHPLSFYEPELAAAQKEE